MKSTEREGHPLRSNPRARRTPDAITESMNTHTLGIPSTALSSDDHLIPALNSLLPNLIEQLASSHAAVLEKWKRNFALDLRRPQVVSLAA
jgi:hypothetical protein